MPLLWTVNRALPGLGFNADSIRFTSPTTVELQGLTLNPPKATAPPIHIKKLTLGLSPKGILQREIESIHIDDPQVVIDDQFLAALSTLLGPNSDVTPISPATPETADPEKLWNLKKFSIQGGTTSIRLSNYAPIDFQFSLSQAESGLIPGTGTLTFTNVKILEPSNAPATVIPALHLEINIRSLQQNHIKKLVIESPILHITPELIAKFSPQTPAPETSSPTPDPTSSPQAPTAAPAPWVIDELIISNGDLFLHDFGPQVPLIQFKFSSAWENFSLNPPPDSEAAKTVHSFRAESLSISPPYAPHSPFLTIEEALLSFSFENLQKQLINAVTVKNAALYVNQEFRSFLGAPAEKTAMTDPASPAAANSPEPTPSSPAAPDNPWKIIDLTLEPSRIFLEDLGTDIPDISFQVATHLEYFALTLNPDIVNTKTESILIHDLTIRSPLDPFIPVLTLGQVRIDFSVQGLLRQQLQSIQIHQPKIYIGKDLFWYFDNLRTATAETPATSSADTTADAISPEKTSSNWSLDRLLIRQGELAIADAGSQKVSLPIRFRSYAENLSFENLSDLRLQLDIEVPPTDYQFEAYQLAIQRLSGDIKFGLPPSTNANNLVNTLTSTQIKWRQFTSQSPWISVTYDKTGIHGEFGGECYAGYINGGFTFLFQDQFPWIGWVSGTKINLDQVTSILAPENFSMTSPANFKLEINATSKIIDRLMGSMTTTQPGTMEIQKLNDLIANIPADYTPLKQDLTRIGLETLRDFQYDSANASFWFIEKNGTLELELAGPYGSRRFEVFVHDTTLSTSHAPSLWENQFKLKPAAP